MSFRDRKMQSRKPSYHSKYLPTRARPTLKRDRDRGAPKSGLTTQLAANRDEDRLLQASASVEKLETADSEDSAFMQVASIYMIANSGDISKEMEDTILAIANESLAGWNEANPTSQITFNPSSLTTSQYDKIRDDISAKTYGAPFSGLYAEQQDVVMSKMYQYGFETIPGQSPTTVPPRIQLKAEEKFVEGKSKVTPWSVYKQHFQPSPDPEGYSGEKSFTQQAEYIKRKEKR